MATSVDTSRSASKEYWRRTNEKPGTRAKLSNLGLSAYKVRAVLDLIRGEQVDRAQEILQFCERGPATPIAKLLHSAVSNARENDGMEPSELFVSACFADEGVTAKRWRPRARGRAGRIRKRSSHITIIVSRLDDATLARLQSQQASTEGSRRARVAGSRAARTAGSKKADVAAASATADENVVEDDAVTEPEVTEESSTPEESGTTVATETDEATADAEKDVK